MTIKIRNVNKVSDETKSAITRKSAQTLPNNPSAKGYSAEEIKRRFYQPIIDTANSTIAEVDRVTEEINAALGDVKDGMDDFIEGVSIKEAYKLELNDATWFLNEESGLYEVVISQLTHGIEDYREIGVDMYLLDGNGRYTRVNQFEIYSNGDVRCFHETNSSGHVSIYVKREGLVRGNIIVDIDHIVGASKVSRTNKYEDLDGLPDLSGIEENSTLLGKIISGEQFVGNATNANDATRAKYANTAGVADTATAATAAQNANNDQYGVNIASNYAKQNGHYNNLTAGNALLADKAKADEEGKNIKNTYAKQSGVYDDLVAGRAKVADKATTVETALKAAGDENGANIASTYAKQNGNYPNMTVGQAKNATTANWVEVADCATRDGEGNNIANTYAKGLSINIEFINIQVRVGNKEDGSDSVDLFRDTGTSFLARAVVASNKSSRYVISSSVVRKIEASSNRVDKKYLFLHIDGLEILNYPLSLRLTSDEYTLSMLANYALNPINIAGSEERSVTINDLDFKAYNLFDESYNFNNKYNVLVEISM